MDNSGKTDGAGRGQAPYSADVAPDAPQDLKGKHGGRDVEKAGVEGKRHITHSPPSGSKPATKRVTRRTVRQREVKESKLKQSDALKLPEILKPKPHTAIGLESQAELNEARKALDASGSIIINGKPLHKDTHLAIRGKIEELDTKLLDMSDVSQMVARDIAAQLTHEEGGALAKSAELFSTRLKMDDDVLQQRSRNAVIERLQNMAEGEVTKGKIEETLTGFHADALMCFSQTEPKPGHFDTLKDACFDDVGKLLAGDSEFSDEANNIRQMLDQFKPENQKALSEQLEKYRIK